MFPRFQKYEILFCYYTMKVKHLLVFLFYFKLHFILYSILPQKSVPDLITHVVAENQDLWKNSQYP